MKVIVVGAGILGTVAALEFRRRGREVVLVDSGPLPHPDAASTDISKVCRMEYGADDHYMALMERTWAGWHAWNDRWRAAGRDPLYHACGVLMMSREPMRDGGFEWESFRRLRQRGYEPVRLSAATLGERFPAWSTGRYVDGFFHAVGGFAESGRVVGRVIEEARDAGVTIREDARIRGLTERAGAVRGVELDGGERLESDAVLVAAGCWTQHLVPELAPFMKATGHGVVHFRPSDPSLFTADRFPVFTADIARTGFYGFPLHPRRGVVKIALHDSGLEIDPHAERAIARAQRDRIRAFVPTAFPALADAEIVETRLCAYSDTLDEDFLIAHHPERDGLSVAAGGSGHAFKFAPILGELIADAVEGRANPALSRFRWGRTIAASGPGEAARFHD